MKNRNNVSSPILLPTTSHFYAAQGVPIVKSHIILNTDSVIENLTRELKQFNGTLRNNDYM